MIWALIADDHAIIREGLKKVLLSTYPDAVIEEVNNGDSLVAKAAERNWSIIISDMSMPGKSVIDAIPEIKAHSPRTPVLVLSMFPEDRYAMRALKAGASGYLNKEAASTEILLAVSTVMSGQKYITAQLAGTLADQLSRKKTDSPLDALSAREMDVFRLLTEGNSILSIAEKLSVNSTTVSTYRARILAKLHLKSNAELIRYALEHKLWE